MATLRSHGPEDLEEFWRAVRASGTPLVEPIDDDTVLVTFLWRGEAEVTNVGWGVDLTLERLPDTDLWYGSVLLPADMRTLYYLSHEAPLTYHLPRNDGGAGLNHLDPLNARRMHFPRTPGDPTDEDTWASVLELPRAPAETWSVEQPDVARGSIVETTLASAAFGTERQVAVYQPAVNDGAELPALVVFDGYSARAVLRIPTTLDNLIAAGRIPPMVALFVQGADADRSDELVPSSERTTEFVARELMPWARREWGVSPYPGNVGLAGVSFGGLAAAHIALRAPDVFGAVIAQSGSYWWPRRDEGEPEWLIREYAHRPRADLRFYLDVGNRETIRLPGGPAPQLEVNRRMRDVLRERGYPVTYAEYPGGHDYVNWRNTFADGLLALFGSTP
jgi:enterochelin esterase-like enzyme